MRRARTCAGGSAAPLKRARHTRKRSSSRSRNPSGATSSGASRKWRHDRVDPGGRRSTTGCDPETGGGSMKYLCLVYGDEKALAGMDDRHCVAYDEKIRASGQCLASEALQPVATATTVRVRNGRV